MMPNSSIGKLRIWGFLEGGSLIALVFVAMPLKYFWGIPEAVKYLGAAHGAFFVFYSIWLLVTSLELKWSFATIAQAFIAAMIPGGTFWADNAIFKKYLNPVKSGNQDSGTDQEN